MNTLRALAIVAATLFQASHALATARVGQIEVRLFFTHTGTFSEPIAERATLWNAVIGEGGLQEPSSSTLVKVLVKAEPKSYDAKTRVQLTVRNGRSGSKVTLLKRLGVFGAAGQQYVAFWLPETGCDELSLEAAIRGSRQSVKHTVPFRCGE